MEAWVSQIVVPLAVAVLTSGGLWALIAKRGGQKRCRAEDAGGAGA